MSQLTKKNGNGKTGVQDVVNEFFDDNFFKPFFNDFGVGLVDRGLNARIPSINISETEKEYRIDVASPGFSKGDFKIRAENGHLIISAEKKSEDKEEKENYHRREFSFQSFTRSFQLPENSKAEDIEAKYENGILRIHLPKKEVTISKSKKEIKVS